MAYSIQLNPTVTANAANNSSTVSGNITLVSTLASQFQGFFLTYYYRDSAITTNHLVNDPGTSTQYSMTGATSTRLTLTANSASRTYTHSTSTGALASKTFAALVDAPNSATYLPQNITNSGAISFTTFTGPSTPAAPTVTRSIPTTINITAQIPSSAGSLAIQRYEYRFSIDAGSTWSSAVSMGGTGTYPSITPTRTAALSATATTQYYIQTRALSNYNTTWGIGPWSTSTIINGIPTAPATISLTRTGKNVLVTAGSATGVGITGYYVQSSSDGGSTWSTAQLMTLQQYNYTTLTSGVTYLFRVYATNSIGNSAFTTSSSLFVAGYGYKRAADNTWTALQDSRIYVGIGGVGADANGWRTVQNVKRYVSDTGSGSPGWIDLVQ